MISIICGSVDFNIIEMIKCTEDKVKLTYRNMATVNVGSIDMWMCDKYTMSDDLKRILAEIEKMMKKGAD